MLTVPHSAISLVPKQPFLSWLKSLGLVDIDASLADLSANATVYLVPECSDDEEMAQHIAHFGSQMFAEQLHGWQPDSSVWPTDMSLPKLCEWFDCRFHLTVVDVCSS